MTTDRLDEAVAWLRQAHGMIDMRYGPPGTNHIDADWLARCDAFLRTPATPPPASCAPEASEAVAWGLRSMGRIYTTRLTWEEAESEAQERQDRDGEGARPDVVALYTHPTPRAEAVVEAAMRLDQCVEDYLESERTAPDLLRAQTALRAAVREYRAKGGGA